MNNRIDKPFKTIDQQISILQSRNLLFHNKETAAKNLERYGYYEIINGYKDNLELDRIDNDKNYEPNNCQWITHKENNNKRGNNRIIELNGQAKTLSEWAEIYNISSNTIWSRLERGWETERAITTLPKNVGRRCWKTRQGCKSKRGEINDN